jgi:hypothetical protein
MPQSPQDFCHSERRKIVLEADDLSESRNPLFASVATNRGALCLASFARHGIPRLIVLEFWKRHDREGHDVSRAIQSQQRRGL